MVDKFSIMSINIRSLPKNFSELEISVDKYKPDIVQLSEVWNPHLGACKNKDLLPWRWSRTFYQKKVQV